MDGTLGLIGLGLVGTALVERFTAAGARVVGYDVDPAAMDRVSERIDVARTPTHVAAKARRIVLSLPNSDVVDEVVDGVDGLVERLQPGDLIVDTTTADPVRSAALAGRLRERRVRFVDATILGSSEQVRHGEVTVLAGGSDEDIAACDDLFSAFARRTFPMGPNGKGAEAKLVVNLVLGLNRLVLAEGLVLGMKSGIDPERLLEVLRGGAAYSRVMDMKGEKMLRGDFTPQARLAQHLKDVDLILEHGRRTGAPLLVSALHAQLLRSAVAAGEGDLDNSAIVEVLARMAGTERSANAAARRS